MCFVLTFFFKFVYLARETNTDKYYVSIGLIILTTFTTAWTD